MVVTAMAEPAVEIPRGIFVPFGRWTAQRALAELPETPEMRIEVFDGSLILSPHANTRHQRIARELGYRLDAAARRLGFEALPEINLVLGENFAIPDFVVVSHRGENHVWINAADVVLAVEIVSPGSRRLDKMVRPAMYAEAGIEYFMRVEFPDEDPVIVLHRLVKDGYEPVSTVAAGSTFAMREPFEFQVDPAELTDV
jgi:Uma2 family endonuclease